MENPTVLLVVERGPIPGLRFSLTAEQSTIGRSGGNDLTIADPEISRRHALVVRQANGFAIEDIGSTNGTFVNGQRISHLTALQDGDTIELGDTVRLRFLWPESPTVVNMSIPAQPAATPAAATAASAATAATPATPLTENDEQSSWWPEPDSEARAWIEMQNMGMPDSRRKTRGRRLLLGCGLPIAVLLLMAGTFLILDAYDGGRLLYCGPLAPLFETLLGPFGFAPLCQ